MFNSNINIFGNNKNSLKSKALDKDMNIQEDLKFELIRKKENQIIERRKKMMKDIYRKMFFDKLNLQNNQSHNKNIPEENMEIEEEFNSHKADLNDKKNKISSIQECLDKEKNIYNELGEEFIYRIIDNNQISFCPRCGYPVIIIDKNVSNNNSEYILIACVNSCFQFELNEKVFNKYSMDNIMDLYSQALKTENSCKHNDISAITSGDDEILFSCLTCLFEQFK